MEAANQQRAALRLAAAAAGVAVTVLLAGTALALLAKPSPPKGVASGDAASESLAPARVRATPVAAVRAESVATSAAHDGESDPNHGPFAYAAPQPEPEPSEDAPWSGPVTIHNPAAMGPPEEDIVPALPRPLAPGQIESPSLARRSEPSNQPIVPGARSAERLLTSKQVLNHPGTARPTPTAPSPAPSTVVASGSPQPKLPVTGDFSYTSSVEGISERLIPDVQAGFQLGKSGAVYAARGRFVNVLRRIAQAKDAAEGTEMHMKALAEGLRTLDQADDFVPRGDALEAELDIDSIARSHGLGLIDPDGSTPAHHAVAVYSHHAAERIGAAVLGERAGSMALYGLGKTYARMEAQSGDPLAGRKSQVMYEAALASHGENYLAANELGVRLAREGRFEQAEQALELAARGPEAPSTVYENLAMVQQRIGQVRLAQAASQQSVALAQAERAAGEVSRRRGVAWVSPQAFQRPQVSFTQPPAPRVASAQPVAPQPNVPQRTVALPPAQATPPAESAGWSRALSYAKGVVGWDEPANSAAPVRQAVRVTPVGPPQPSVIR